MDSRLPIQFKICCKTYIDKETCYLMLNDKRSDEALNLSRLANFNIALAMIYYLGDRAVKSSETAQDIFLRTQRKQFLRSDNGERQYRQTLTNVSRI